MFEIHSRSFFVVTVIYGKKNCQQILTQHPHPPRVILVSSGYKIIHLSTASSYSPVDCKSCSEAVNSAPKTKALLNRLLGCPSL